MATIDEQKCEFEQRRLAVMRKHLANDPKLKAVLRKRKRSLFASVIGSLVVIGVVMVLIKGFMIAHEGSQGYARLIAPALQGQAEGSVLGLMLRPDPVSTELAAIIAPILPRPANPARASLPDAVSIGPIPPAMEAVDQP